MPKDSQPSQVRDSIQDKSGIITNFLMVIILSVGGFFGQRVVDKLDKIYDAANLALTQIAVIHEVDERQDNDIKKLETWKEGANNDINDLKSWKETQIEYEYRKR